MTAPTKTIKLDHRNHIGKIVCVGRNYAEHARELGNAIPDEPLLFMKPASAICSFSPSFSIPGDRGECHIETEIALYIGKTIDATTADPLHSVRGVGIALDLTLRDVQSELKAKGHPWEKAKAFDGSCVVTPFIDAALIKDWDHLELELLRNGQRQQHGSSAQMLVSIKDLLSYIATWFTLDPGDLVLTGTPAGVCALKDRDVLEVKLDGGTLLTETARVLLRDTVALSQANAAP